MVSKDPRAATGVLAACLVTLALSCTPEAYEVRDGGTDAGAEEPCPYLRPAMVGSKASFEHRSSGELQHTYESEIVAEVEFESRSALQYAGRMTTVAGDVQVFDVYESRSEACEVYLWEEDVQSWTLIHQGSPSSGAMFETYDGVWASTWGAGTHISTPAGDFEDCFELASVAREGEANESRLRDVYCRGVGLVVSTWDAEAAASNTLVAYDW